MATHGKPPSDCRHGCTLIPQKVRLRTCFKPWCLITCWSKDSSIIRKYPKINLKLRAPLELENLLPYNLEYRIYDKNTNQNWKSYLRQGGIMPVHSVELGHFILLNVNLEETGKSSSTSIKMNEHSSYLTPVYKPSEFTIINTDGHSDFDIENTLTLRDQYDRKLDLKLNYVSVIYMYVRAA